MTAMARMAAAMAAAMAGAMAGRRAAAKPGSEECSDGAVYAAPSRPWLSPGSSPIMGRSQQVKQTGERGEERQQRPPLVHTAPQEVLP